MAHFFFAHQTRTPFMFILFCVYYHYKIVCCIYYIIMLDKCCHYTEAWALERRTNSCSYHERYAVRCVLIAIFHLKWSHYSWIQVSTHSVTSDLVWIFLMLMIFVGEIGLEFYQSFFPSIINNYTYLSVSDTWFQTWKFLLCAMRESYFSNSDHLSTE